MKAAKKCLQYNYTSILEENQVHNQCAVTNIIRERSGIPDAVQTNNAPWKELGGKKTPRSESPRSRGRPVPDGHITTKELKLIENKWRKTDKYCYSWGMSTSSVDIDISH